MIVIRVQFKIQPQYDAAFRAHMKKEITEVSAMKGCVRYALFQAVDGDGYLLYEEWSTAADFAEYKSSDQLKNSFVVLGPMMAGPPDSAYYEAVVMPAKQ